MPIIRTYACEDCFHTLEVTLTAAQWDDPPPACPACAARQMQQEFKAPGIVNSSASSIAHKITENIIGNDYHVADYNRSPSRSNLRYKDPGSDRSTWGVAQEALQGAIQAGRQVRQRYGNGLDVLQTNLANGTEPDLIALSKKRAMKIW